MINRQRSTLLLSFGVLVLGAILMPITLNAQAGYTHAQTGYTMSYPGSPYVRYALGHPPPNRRGYSYNDGHGGITVDSFGRGVYVVLFRQLGRKGPGRGFAQASAYGPGQPGAFCRVEKWDSQANGGRDFRVDVDCANSHGRVDTQFTVLAGWPGGGLHTVPGIHKIPAKHLPPLVLANDDTADTSGVTRQLQNEINFLNDQINAIRKELNKLAQ